MAESAAWVSAIASCVSALAVGLLVYQLHLQREEIRQDHERSRREFAVQVMLEWVKTVDRATNIVTRFVDLLDREQARALEAQEDMKLSLDKRDRVEAVLDVLRIDRAELKDHNGACVLGATAVVQIRAQAVNYLNMLETALTAARHNVADQQMIVEELRPLYNPARGDYLLENFRAAAGGSGAFPAIESFSQEWKARLAALPHAKPPLG